MISKWTWPKEEDSLKKEDDLKNEDCLINQDSLKKEGDLKNKGSQQCQEDQYSQNTVQMAYLVKMVKKVTWNCPLGNMVVVVNKINMIKTWHKGWDIELLRN